ncbi:hypothetical protein L1987_58516 [Smallanthus sonchifolius]|uniref:Uncharacterized protein n=1 Tax=Smallanthus sonchifolius TaxID=185202 RepID=A0ACB9DFG2_9ASTR|nr:hypothetical protein L1987_58516 [Smallanthus sonchifolius]
MGCGGVWPDIAARDETVHYSFVIYCFELVVWKNGVGCNCTQALFTIVCLQGMILNALALLEVTKQIYKYICMYILLTNWNINTRAPVMGLNPGACRPYLAISKYVVHLWSNDTNVGGKPLLLPK